MIVNEALNTHSNYFVVPNAIYSLGLSPGAIAVYCFLLRLECRKPGEDRYTCHPSMATIGRAIGRGRKTVAKYVDELVEAGLVLTEPTKVTTADGLRWNGNLKYTLLDPRRAVDLFHERQLEAGVRKKRKAMKKAEKKRQRKQKPHDEYVAERSAHAPEKLPF